MTLQISDDKKTIARLERKIEGLEFRISEMLSECQAPPIPGLTRIQFQLVQALARRAPMALPYDALAASVNDKAHLLVDAKQNLTVHFCRIRKHLKPFGVEVETVRAIGYRMPVESKAKWQTLVDQANGRAAA